MLVNLGVPVFISPVTEQLSLTRPIAGVGISIQNSGNVTVQLLGLEASGCEAVKFNRYLRPTDSIVIPLAPEQTAKCAYQARLDSGLLSLQ